LQALGAEPDPAVVFAEAERRQGAGEREDAYLLYRYAARHGHAQAAMTLGTAADPAYHSATSSFLPEPAPGQARKWYSIAAAAGFAEAGQRLEALRARLERDAAAGDEQAQRLLLLWR
jgi:TPR repeat protein